MTINYQFGNAGGRDDPRGATPGVVAGRQPPLFTYEERTHVFVTVRPDELSAAAMALRVSGRR